MAVMSDDDPRLQADLIVVHQSHGWQVPNGCDMVVKIAYDPWHLVMRVHAIEEVVTDTRVMNTFQQLIHGDKDMGCPVLLFLLRSAVFVPFDCI